MMKLRQRTYLLAFLALVVLFAGCKGESPTAPPVVPTTTAGPGTGTASSPDVALSVSKSDPQVNSTVVITATVTQGGQPVPNGTAVEFRTTIGTFTDVSANVAIKTTTNGVATENLTSATAGATTITATVGNVAKTTTVTFQLAPVTPPPPDLTPAITGVSPTTVSPAGGTVVTITGKNFAAPVKVLFDFGAGTTPKEAFIVSTTPTQIQVLSPAIDLGAGQQTTATITLINQLGTPNEVRVTSGATTITFQNTTLTPKITTVSPASGPIDGGTRVTIFGEGFQAPVQVFFAPIPLSPVNPGAEAQVINVTFSQITVIAPRASATAPAGSGNITGPIDIRVINVNSETTVTAQGVFRYIAKILVTAAGPTQGPVTGGTDISIDGQGFNDPVTVTVAGVAAQVLKVSGTEILARTSGVLLTACAAPSPGPIIVTNIDNGDTSGPGGPFFTYLFAKPVIAGVTPLTVSPGGTVTVTIANSQPGVNRFQVGGNSVFATPGALNPDGSQSFTLTVPPASSFSFTSQPCTVTVGGVPVAGTQLLPVSADITFTNVQTGCPDTAAKILTVNPPSLACVIPPPPVASAAPASGTALPAGASTVGTPSATQPTVTISDAAGTQSLQVTSATITGANAGDFTVAPTSATVAAGASATFTVTFTPTAAGARTGTLTITTNDAAHPTFTYPLTGTGI